jgi:hypothetical protein
MALLRKKSVSSRVRRSLKTRGQRRKPSTEYYTIYLGDSAFNLPLFGTISRYALDKLGATVASLQKLPNSGKYKSEGGLQLDYNFKDGVLFKQTTGKIGAVDYNSNLPVPLTKHANKLDIYLEGSKTAVGSAISKSSARVQQKISIGIPATADLATVASFVISLKIDKNPKALRWKYGKHSETLREFSGKKTRTKGDAQGTWYIPIGIDANIKRNKDGSASNAKNGSKQRLVIATIKENAAETLGFTNPKVATEKDLVSGTNIAKTLENNGTGDSVYRVKAFKKPEIYTTIWEKSGESGVALAADPGTAITVKARITSVVGGASSVATKGKFKQRSRTVSFALPASTPVSLVYEFLMNAPKRPTSFQMSSDGKVFGSSYPLAPSKARLKK